VIGRQGSAVVPAKAGTHIPEAVVMGPAFAGTTVYNFSNPERAPRLRSWQDKPSGNGL